jgi:diguanylate cyclase (GGDEF)-like protein/PAS domain S-box-containing protein
MKNAIPASLINILIKDSIDAVVIIDGRSAIRYVNPALEALAGYAHDALIGAPLSSLLPPELAGHHGDVVAAYGGRGGPSTILGHVREMALRHQDGSIIPIEMKAIDLGTHEGMRFYGAFMQDLRPRKTLEAERQELIDRLQRQALTDSLTELPNRRAFDSETVRTMAQMRRSGQPVAIALLDIDRFKHVNDRFGHAAGDEVLRMIARVIPSSLRAGDFVARIGGEEFALLLPNTPLVQAIPVLERLREAIAAGETTTGDGQKVAVTVSIGLAALDATHDFDMSWRRADLALYRAKQAGRNRVAV